MIDSELPMKCDKPLRVLGIDLGTTNSVMTEIKWQPGSPPETRVIQIEQDTPLGSFTDILFPSVFAIEYGSPLVPMPQSTEKNARLIARFDKRLSYTLHEADVHYPRAPKCRV